MGRSKDNPSKVTKSPPRPTNRKRKANKSPEIRAIPHEQEFERDQSETDIVRAFTWNKKQPLKAQVKVLEERVHELEAYWNFPNTRRDFSVGEAEWSLVDPRLLQKEFQAISSHLFNWVLEWASHDISHMTKGQKRRLVAHLDDYIVQDDFDNIYARLCPGPQKIFPRILTQMFLNKYVVDNFHKTPFWYLDENVHPGDDHANLVWKGATPGGQILNTLYTRFQQVNDEHSHIWRMLTVRLCNSDRLGQTDDFTLGRAMKEYRDANCTAIATHLLADKTFSCLLKETNGKDDQRLKNLSVALQDVAQVAMAMSSSITSLQFHTLNDLEKRISGNSEYMKTEGYSSAYNDKKEFQLEGHRVLGIIQPQISRRMNDSELEEEIELVAKATIFVENEKTEDGSDGSDGTEA